MITGPMFSGKTAELIRLINRSRIGGKVVQVFKFTDDARYADASTLASYDGNVLGAIPTLTADDITHNLNMDADVVVIDEVQFYDDAILDLVVCLVDIKKEVVCGGLNLDFRAEPFLFRNSKRGVADILVRADKIIKLSAICTHKADGKPCGQSATRTQRIINEVPAHYSSPVVMIGAQDSYEARCTEHHFVPGHPSLGQTMALNEKITTLIQGKISV